MQLLSVVIALINTTARYIALIGKIKLGTLLENVLPMCISVVTLLIVRLRWRPL